MLESERKEHLLANSVTLCVGAQPPLMFSDLLMVVMKPTMSYAVPLYDMGFAADQMEETWIQIVAIEQWVELLEHRALIAPKAGPTPTEVPAEHTVPISAAFSLNKLVTIGCEDSATLAMLVAMLSEWTSTPLFAGIFMCGGGGVRQNNHNCGCRGRQGNTIAVTTAENSSPPRFGCTRGFSFEECTWRACHGGVRYSPN